MQAFSMTWPPPFPLFAYALILIDQPSPLSANVIIECPQETFILDHNFLYHSFLYQSFLHRNCPHQRNFHIVSNIFRHFIFFKNVFRFFRKHFRIISSTYSKNYQSMLAISKYIENLFLIFYLHEKLWWFFLHKILFLILDVYYCQQVHYLILF